MKNIYTKVPTSIISRSPLSGICSSETWQTPDRNLRGINDVRAFTLIELLVVVLIIGILAAVALPQYQVAVEKSRAARRITLCRALLDAQERYFLANGTYTAEIDELDIDIPYTSKTISTTGRVDYRLSNASFRLYPSGNLCVTSGNGWTIDLHKRDVTSICYPSNTDTIGERVCKSFGPKIEGRTSGANTAVYEIKY